MTPKSTRKWLKRHNDLNLDGALDTVQVEELDQYIVDENKKQGIIYPDHMVGWWIVSNDWGILGYFASESEALSYRLNFINRILNK